MNTEAPSSVVWFRRDLRLADHPALADAMAHSATVVPLYVLDERLMARSSVRAWYLAGALRSLDAELRTRGSALLVRSGPPERVVPEVAARYAAADVYASRDVTPYSHRRDRAVAAALAGQAARLRLRAGTLLVEPDRLLNGEGAPYRVFTPFWRALQRADRRPGLEPPTIVPGPDHSASWTLPGELQAAPPPLADLPEPGEGAARGRLRRWVEHSLVDYGHDRDGLDGSGTSHLGADLHFGSLSPLQVELAAGDSGEGALAFRRQLAWREFYHHLAFHQRDGELWSATDRLSSAFRSEADEPAAVEAWRDGTTGIPTVDAGMRQLRQVGWLGNRARLIVASFLTRHLLMDYRIGERHFMRYLVDGDVANNRGGWQWTAGVGADPQPWFRIFNPVRQGKRFDVDGRWVRRWVPELDAVPTRYVHAPWEMPAQVAAAAGVRLGDDYPRPIVDLAEARGRALAAFKSVTG